MVNDFSNDAVCWLALISGIPVRSTTTEVLELGFNLVVFSVVIAPTGLCVCSMTLPAQLDPPVSA